MSKQAFKRLRRRLGMAINRTPPDAYAWPGGYPVFYVCGDNGILCPACVAKEIKLIDDATDATHDRQWRIIAYGVNYDDETMHCDHCSGPIEPAYGEGNEEAKA